MAPENPRCSTRSLDLDEPMAGTASTVRNWILLEQPGPWGYDAISQSRIPMTLAGELAARAVAARARLILLRRSGRSDPDSRHCFIGRSGPGEPRFVHGVVETPSDLLHLDLDPVARDEPLGWGRPDREPLFLVCTNGRRDRCCAERGRPVAMALAAEFGDRVWECSHIGGDRFAGNLVCFPHGVYYGRVDPDDAVRIGRDYAAGILDLDHYRGRSCYPFAVQAAEAHLRRREALGGIAEVQLLDHSDPTAPTVRARFAGPAGRSFVVRVSVSAAGQARPLTCHSREARHPPTYEVLPAGE